jgi:hypothetical protein
MWRKVMFEGLDEIDWENLGISHYGENKKIPQNIRNRKGCA